MKRLIQSMIDLEFVEIEHEESHQIWIGKGSRYGEAITVGIREDGTISMMKLAADDDDQPIHVTWNRYDEAMIDTLEKWAR